jgi:K+-sensing histidine kinase KdpD
MNYSTKIPVIEIHQTVQDKNVKIEIIDHGSGISQEDLPYVFDRYYRSSESHIRSTVGSGLGLSIVKSILESHKIPETEYAVKMLFSTLAKMNVNSAHILLDEPVSNSGRLKALIADIKEEQDKC